MDINGIIVLTPHDPGLGVEFEPDWRRKVAVAWTDSDRWFPPKYIFDDEWIRCYVDYLRLLKYTGNQTLPSGFNDIQDAEALYASGDAGIKGMLEPLLMSGIELQCLIRDLAPVVQFRRDPDDIDRLMRIVRLYERLFFNIRDDHGNANLSLVTRTYFALRGATLDERIPDSRMPMVASAFFGYTALTHFFHNGMHAHGKLEDARKVQGYILRELQIHMLCRVLKKQYNNFDSTMLLGKNIEYEKMLFDTKAVGEEKNTYRGIVVDILQESAPALLEAAQTAEERLKSNTFVHDQWTARKNVMSQAVTDAGVEGASLQLFAQMKQRNFDEQGLGGVNK